VLLLSADHTQGTSPGYPTPRASVADNDLAVGRLVEAVSNSSYWKESAIFVTEDDSQDGLDHVDGHRTVGLVISPWVKRGVVDSNFYSIINMYRTMKQILGLAPSNQFDLAAEPMFSVFTDQPDFSPYRALPNHIPLDEMNPQLSATSGLQRKLAEASIHMDFSEPDAADAQTLNRAIWHSVKGYDVAYGLSPAPRR
jgi:Phosphoesterase family